MAERKEPNPNQVVIVWPLERDQYIMRGRGFLWAMSRADAKRLVADPRSVGEDYRLWYDCSITPHDQPVEVSEEHEKLVADLGVTVMDSLALREGVEYET